jgi:hypothetical protein
MATGFLTKTDLYNIYNYVQNSGQAYCKEITIEALRDFFSRDSFYRFVRDQWGFNLTPSQEGLPLDAGINDNTTTRLFIGDYYRGDAVFFPAIFVKSGGYRYVPISMSRDKYSVKWSNIKYVDGYGNESIVRTPTHFCQDGAWEGSLNIEIQARDSQTRDELVDLCMLFLTDTMWEDFAVSGLVIKPPNAGAPAESDDRNAKIFKQTISFDFRSEWLREIPVSNIIEIINICVEIGNTNSTPETYAPNLQINTSVELAEALLTI